MAENFTKLSSLVNKMAESETLKMARMGRELRALGHDVISLSLGEPDFDTPKHIKKAATLALDEGYTKYTPVAGLLELQQAISAKFKRDSGLIYQTNEIVVSNGAKQSIANLALALLDEGDEVVIFAPYWVSYWEIVKMAGGVPIAVTAGVKQDFKPTAKQLEKAITPKTKFVLFSSPCNPTGTVFKEKELRSYAEVMKKYPNVLMVSDEIYEYINFQGKHISIGALGICDEQVVTVNGFAKGFAMTGWRLGYIGAPKYVADACSKIQGQFTSGASAFGQKAAVTALTTSMKPTDKMRAEFKRRRDMVLDLLNDIPGIKTNKPMGAFYVFPDISSFFGKKYKETVIKNSDDFCDYIMMNAYVGLVSGAAFGDNDCFRISYAASEKDLRDALARLKDWCGKLK
jgi:aspartate aminotransferase